MKRVALLAAVAALIAALVWWDRGRPTTVDSKRATEELAPRLGTVDRIVIERRPRSVTMVSDHGQWRLQNGTRADDRAVDALLSTLRYGRVERLVDARLDVKLDRAHIVAGDVDLRLGEDAPGRGLYVRRGDQLLVAESRLAEVAAADFRSRSAVLDDVSAASTVQIGPLALERQAAGWRVVAPRPALGDPQAVQQLLDALAAARADSFAAGPPPSPAPADDVIALDGRVQGRIHWDGDKGCGKLPHVARADGAVLCFAEATLAPLKARVDDLRLGRLTTLALDDIDAADFEIAGKKLSLVRADHEWRMVAPQAAPAEDRLVRERLQALLQLKARAFAPPGAVPIGHARLAGGGDEVQLTLTKSGYEILVQRKAEDGALILPGTALKLFDADPLPLLSRRVDTYRPDSVTMVSFDGRPLPAHSPLVTALADLHAETVQQRSFLVRHTLRITAAGAVHTYLIGPADADGCLLRTRDDGPAYVIAPATCKLLADE
jgi:hypothetical protein